MREIKFRVWFHEPGTGNGVFVDGDEAFKENFIDWCGPELCPTDECSIVEQFTGLHDKNGVEIYEGDILHIDNNMWSSNDPSPGIRVVKWNEEAPEFSAAYVDGNCGTSGYMFVPANTKKLYEVIGNIHENPELLNGA